MKNNQDKKNITDDIIEAIDRVRKLNINSRQEAAILGFIKGIETAELIAPEAVDLNKDIKSAS